MKKRQYYLHSNVSQTQQLVDKLLLARISESNIHVIANQETTLGSLPKASPLQTSNIIQSIESGLVIGGITGLVASIAIALSLQHGGQQHT